MYSDGVPYTCEMHNASGGRIFTGCVPSGEGFPKPAPSTSTVDWPFLTFVVSCVVLALVVAICLLIVWAFVESMKARKG